MFEEVYGDKSLENVGKYVYDELYEEHQRTLRKLKKLNDRLYKILKQSDNFFSERMSYIEKQQKEKHRYEKIIKISDREGKALLDNTFSLESILEEKLENEEILNQEIRETQKEIIFLLGAVAESRSNETANHVKRVALYCQLLGKYYGLSEYETEILKQASPLHDIGKIGIEDAILKKPGKLTPEEFEIMKTHATIGYELLRPSHKHILQAGAIIAHQHHEWMNGEGYPNNLKGDEIHIFGRIAALADVFDALGSKRVYKDAWGDEEIFEHIKMRSGTQFDPRLVNIFLEHKEEFLDIRKRHAR